MLNWRHHLFFWGHRLIGSGVQRHYGEFLRLQSVPVARLRQLQEDRLKRILSEAVSRIPFYRAQIRCQEPRLADFPILTKALIKEHFTELMTTRLEAEYHGRAKKRPYSWVEVKTGGSTGVPTRVIHDADFRDCGRASRLFAQHVCGFPLGTPYFMLWGSMRDISDARSSLQKAALHLFLNTRLLNAFRMDETRMDQYAARLNHGPIRHLMAYADAADQLVRHIQSRRLPMRPFESVMACGGTVTPAMRQRIESVFAGRLHNKYGSRECTDMACECARGGFHIFSHHVHLEVVDEVGRPAPLGETGRVLVTLLGNFSFPLIRYEIGDVGSFSPDVCPCGLPFPLLSRIEGRTLEQLTDTRGNRVTPIYIRHLIGVENNPDDRLRRFQLNQLPDRRYQLLLEAAEFDCDWVARNAAPAISRALKVVLGDDAQLDLQVLSQIPESDGGKFLYVRNLSTRNHG